MITLVACAMCGMKMEVTRNGIVAQLGESYFNGDAYKCPECQMSVFATESIGSNIAEPVELMVQTSIITRLVQLADKLDGEGLIKEANIIDDLVNKIKGKKPESKSEPRVLTYEVTPKEVENVKKLVADNNDNKLIGFLGQMIQDRLMKFSYSIGGY